MDVSLHLLIFGFFVERSNGDYTRSELCDEPTQNGLTIKPFRKAHANRDSDRELVKLTQYLLAIADLDDISILDHKKWESYDEANFKRRRHT
ncbi:hypothetical protein OSB04_030939 [Centaurea solstitialis]|uniref:Uncharacterized protein n=1 Tax=Centaurea solstitialis TaxID=347529 RepID=A0AA38W7M7_9ASTR|nr:hypothetical protein OSB04_030939 [Centaurea solstitialis]